MKITKAAILCQKIICVPALCCRGKVFFRKIILINYDVTDNRDKVSKTLRNEETCKFLE